MTPQTPKQPDSKWLRFEFHGRSPSGKTEVWTVGHVKSGEWLGEIAWFGRWRQYVFEPALGTVFSKGCLEDLAEFLGWLKDARK